MRFSGQFPYAGLLLYHHSITARDCSHNANRAIIKNETEKRTVLENQRLLSEATKADKNQRLGRIERGAIRSGKWVQTEGPVQRIRRLACDICPDKPLDPKGCSTRGVSTFTATEDHSNKSPESVKFACALSLKSLVFAMDFSLFTS